MACCRQNKKAAYIYSSLPVVRGNVGANLAITILDGNEDDDVTRSSHLLRSVKRRRKDDKPPGMKLVPTRPKFGDASSAEDRVVEANGRISIHTQTGLYLFEISDVIETDDYGVQTEQFIDRPMSPVIEFVKTGIDFTTQTEPWELFDFNTEVVPMLEVLLNRTMEQSLMEVMEEEELAEIRAKQAAFEEVRDAELAEVKRLEELNRRRREEQKRRREQAEYAAIMKRQTIEKIAARSFVKGYLEPLLPNTFELLTARGFFYDDVRLELEVNFIDNIVEKAMDMYTLELRGRIIVDGIIREAVNRRHTEYRDLGREIATEAIMEKVVPALRTRVSGAFVETMIDFSIERMEVTAAARRRVLRNVTSDVMDEIINEAVGKIMTRMAEENVDGSNFVDERGVD
ncbi:unnamed protein product [Hydatigera taeniaeformis]|uniref:Radial spoke head protein 3 n=1 Tax=Hydatigena taeniaeformis TaxID=6205 RepID=A0A0R3WJ98_HYDTA|nr:unnamed protein product [Hydatigera taeniaeformis]